MSDNTNGLPGASAMNDTLEFVRNFWGSMKIPGMTMPSMSPDDINKQITDLKAVESWLQMNMNILRSTIQTLEVQSATLSTLQSMSDSFANAGKSGGKDSSMPAFESPFTQATVDQPPAMLDPAAFAAQFANTAGWWNNLQEQFSNAVNAAITPPKKSARKSDASKSATNKSAAGSAKKRSTSSRKSPRKT